MHFLKHIYMWYVNDNKYVRTILKITIISIGTFLLYNYKVHFYVKYEIQINYSIV